MIENESETSDGVPVHIEPEEVWPILLEIAPTVLPDHANHQR